MAPRLGLLPRIALYVVFGLLAVALATTSAREGRIVDVVIRTVLIAAVFGFVVVTVRSNGSRLMKAVARLRPSDPIFEIVRSDGNESDVRELGLSGPGLNRHFVIVLVDRGLEVWVDDSRDQPSLTVPWQSISRVDTSTLPFSEGLLRPSADAIIVEIDHPHSVAFALNPFSRGLRARSRREDLARLLAALDERIEPSEARP